MIILFTVMLLVLLATGLPVGFALGTGGLVGMLLFMGGDGTLNQIPLLAYKSLDDFVLCAVPLYVLMSQILLEGKVGNDLFELGNKWLRHLPGGLGAATIVACGIFAAITGSSAACAVTIGAIAIPEMLKRNYERTVVLGAVAAGGTLGILIPPSIPMILYGAITGESIGQLFMSGVVPGFMLTIFFIGVVVYKSRNLPLEPKASWAERMDALKSSIWGLMLPVIVVGGIYTGAFTPTEAAAVGTVYSLFITFCIYKTLSLKHLPNILLGTVKTSSMIFCIMIGATLFGFVLTILQVPQALTLMVTEMQFSRWIFFIMINCLLLFLGCILDPIWFNVILQINMEMALITPPVGMNLFVLQGVSPDSKMTQIVKGVIPYAVVMGIEMLILCFVPGLATWLPSVVK